MDDIHNDEIRCHSWQNGHFSEGLQRFWHTVFKISVVCYTWNHKIIKVRSSTHTVTVQNELQQGKQTENFKSRHKKVYLHCIMYYMPHFCLLFEFINSIIEKHYLTQCLPVQSPHTTTAILFCDITDNSRIVITTSRNLIADIAHLLLYILCLYLLFKFISVVRQLLWSFCFVHSGWFLSHFSLYTCKHTHVYTPHSCNCILQPITNDSEYLITLAATQTNIQFTYSYKLSFNRLHDEHTIVHKGSLSSEMGP